LFYPDFYLYLRVNGGFFTKKNREGFYISDGSQSGTVREFDKKHFDLLIEKQNIDNNLQNTLFELFPTLFNLTSSTTDNLIDYDKWLLDKRICCAEYFPQYFAYSIVKGQLSSLLFSEAERFIFECDVSDAYNYFILNIPNNLFNEFMSKVRININNYGSDGCQKMAEFLIYYYQFNPEKDIKNYSLFSHITTWSILVTNLIENISPSENRFIVTKSLFNKYLNFKPAYELLLALYGGKNKELSGKLFAIVEFNEIENIILNKAIFESNGKHLFETFPNESSFLYSIWSFAWGKDDLNKSLKSELNKHPLKVMDLLKIFTHLIHSSIHKEPYYGDLTEENYESIKSLLNVEYLADIIKQHANLNNYEYRHLGFEQNPNNLMKQFMYFYEKDISANNSNITN
jgi:hypothetical protein